MKRFTLMIYFLVLLFSPMAHSTDWDSCADDLDALRRAARDASDAANEVKSKAEELETCKQDSDTDKDCSSEAYQYDSEKSSFESELSSVASRVRLVSMSCGMDLSSTTTRGLKKNSK